MEEKRRKVEIEEEMIKVEEKDHFDLQQMLSTLNEENVPQDLVIFWKQQMKIQIQNENDLPPQ